MKHYKTTAMANSQQTILTVNNSRKGNTVQSTKLIKKKHDIQTSKIVDLNEIEMLDAHMTIQARQENSAPYIHVHRTIQVRDNSR